MKLKMYTFYFSLFLSFSFFSSSPFSVRSQSTTTTLDPSSSSLYLSPTIFFPDYQNMLKSFKIYIYAPPKPFSFSSSVESLFFSSLQDSPFITQNPEEAHLFFVPFPSDLSTRSIARLIKGLRLQLPYWNRTLGADHFYVSCAGLGFESNRNLVELKKNSVQLSCFPSRHGNFVPHKDISFPPLANPHATGSTETEPSDQFCLFDYGGANISGIGEALKLGCVPVVITDRPMQDLPLMDVVRWQEIVVFLGSSEGVKSVVDSRCGACEGMRRLGVAASQHFVWNQRPEPYDAFYMVMYQLWLRRHTIRYSRAELI